MWTDVDVTSRLYRTCAGTRKYTRVVRSIQMPAIPTLRSDSMCRTCHWKCYFPRIIFFAYENMVVGQQITFCVPLTACTLRLDTARENAVLVHIRYGHLKGEREKWSKSESFKWHVASCEGLIHDFRLLQNCTVLLRLDTQKRWISSCLCLFLSTSTRIEGVHEPLCSR